MLIPIILVKNLNRKRDLLKILLTFTLLFAANINVSIASKSTWDGSSSSAWATAANWTTSNGGSAPPSATDTVVIVSVSNQPTLPNSALTLSNLIMNGGTLTQGGNSSTLTVTNNLTINSGATLNMLGEPLTVNGTLSISGTLSTSTGTSHNYKNVSINSGGTYITTSSTINVTGNWTDDGTFTYGTSTVKFTGTISQTISGNNFYDLTINNGAGGSCTLGDDISVIHDLTFTAGTFNASSKTVNIKRNIAGTVANLNAQTSTFTFNGTAAQTIPNGTIFKNVIVNGSGSIVSPASGNINITGNLTVTLGTFDQGGAGVTVTGSGASNTLRVQAGGTLVIRAAGTTPYATGFPGWETRTLDDGSTIEWATANTKTWDITSFKNVLVSTGTNSLGANTTIAGDLTFTGGSLTTTASNYSLTTTGDLDIGTATLTANASTITVGGNFSGTGTLTPGTSTFVFNGTGAQSIGTTTGLGNFNNFTINKASGTATLTGAVTINGDATVTSGTFDFSTYTFQRGTSGGTITLSNGATIRVGGTQTTYNFAAGVAGETSTVEYYGAAQTVMPANYGNLILSGSGSKTMPAYPIEVDGNFTMSGTCSATAAAAITFNGNVTIGSGTTFSASSYSHVLKGNWTKSGTFNGNTSTFTLSGSGAQTINSATTFNNLTINNSSGITLGATTTVSGTLTLTSGLVTTGSYELSVTSTSGSSITGHSASSYIVGKLRRAVTLTGSYDFPLGTSSNYQFINCTFTAQLGISNVLGTFTGANPTPSGLPAPLTYNGKSYGKALNHGYWSLTPNSAMIAGVYAVTLKGKGYTNALSNLISDYVVIKRHDGASSWGIGGLPDLLNQLLGGGILTTIATGLTSFSDFAEATTCDVTTAVAGANQSVCGTSTTLAANIPTVGTGAWSIASGTGGTITNSASPTSTFTGTLGSTYSLVWTISNSPCTASTDTVVIAFNSNPAPSINAIESSGTSNDGTICSGSSAALTTTASFTSYSWNTNATTQSISVSPTATTTYTVTVTNSGGCTGSATKTITVNALPTVSAGSAFTKTCSSNASGAAIGESNDATSTYAWTPSSGLSSTTVSNPTANPTATTTYTVTKTKTSGGCTATATVTVTVNTTAPTVSAGSTFTKTCTSNTSGAAIGESNDATATYAWSPATGLSSATASNPTANPTATTTYTVTKTKTANGCTVTGTVTVTVNNTAPSVSAGSAFTKTCTSNASGAAIGESNDASATYAWSPSSGLSSTTISNPTANPTATTTYTVTKTKTANGCTATGTVTVTVNNTAPSVSAGSAFTKTCTSNTSGAAIGESNDVTATYAWTPSSGLSSTTVSNPTANPTATTTYTVTKTKTTNGCTAMGTVTVTVNNAAPSVSAGSAFTKTCTSNTSGAAIGEANDATATYAWTPSSGLSSTTVSNPTANPNVTTTYTVTKTITANGCTATATVTLTINNNAPSVSAGSAFTKTCTSNASGATIGEANDATATYAWSPSSGLSSTTVSNPTANPTATTTYTVTKTTTANGCTAYATVTATVSNSAPSVSAGSAFTKTCTSNASGAAIGEANDATATYAWSPSSGLSSTTVSNPTANPTTTTTYTVTKTKTANGCTSAATVTVTVNTTSPSVSAGSAFTKTCTTNASGAAIGEANDATATYAWTPSSGLNSTTVSNPTANPTATTTYTVTKTITANGCSATSTVTVTVDRTSPSPSTSVSETSGTTSNDGTICTAASATISTTATFNGYAWNTGAATQSISVSPTVTTTYTVTVTGSNGCTANATKTIAVNVNPTATISPSGSTSLCAASGGLLLTASSNGSSPSYQWKKDGDNISGAVSSTYNATATGDYSVVVTSVGCSLQSVATSILPGNIPLPVDTILGPFVVCPGTPGVVYSVPEVAGATSYQWILPSKGGVTLVSGQGTRTVTLNFGSTWINGPIMVFTSNGCGNDIIGNGIQVKSVSHSASAIAGPISVCPGQTGIVYSVDAMPLYATSYTWTTPVGAEITSGQGSNSIVVSFSNTWTTGGLTVIANNACGVSDSKSFGVRSVPASVGTIAGIAQLCPNSTATYSVAVVSGAESYTWTTPTGMDITSGQNTNSINVSTNNAWLNGSVTVVANNSCGSTIAKTLPLKSVLTAPAAITISGGTAKVCPGDSRSFSLAAVAGASSYIWTVPAGASISGNNNTTSINVSFGSSFTATGNVSVAANNACGSSASKSLTITLGTPATPGTIGLTSGNAKVCPGESRTYSIAPVAGANGYTWSVPSGANINGAGTTYTGTGTSVPVSFTSGFASASVVLSVQANNTCGSSAAKTLSIARNTVTAPGAIAGIADVCPNMPGFVFSVPAIANATNYTWTAPAGAIINNQGTNSVTVDFGTTIGAITVATANGCGNSAAKSKALKKLCNGGKEAKKTDIKTEEAEGTVSDDTEPTESPKTETQNPKPTTPNPQPTAQEQTELVAPVFDTPNAFNLQVYPDAEEGRITLTFNADKAGVFKYKILDPSDNELMSGKVKAIEGVNMEQVDVSSLPKTVLTIKLEDGTTSTHVNVTMQ